MEFVLTAIQIQLHQIHAFTNFKLQVRNILGEEGEKADLLCSGPTLAMELVMEDAVNKFAQLANNKVATLLFPRNLTQHSIAY